jgi:hypothetical protein
MPIGNPWRSLAAIEFANARWRQRAASYRERIALLLTMANDEPNPGRRGQLRDLAAQYEELVDGLED